MTQYLASIPSPPRGVWNLGPIPLRAYAGFIILGIIVGVVWGGRRYVARGGAKGRVADLAVWAVPFGLVGGRLYHVLTDHALYFGAGKNPWQAFAIWDGGLGIPGAVALGSLGIWLGCRHYKIPMPPVADALAPGLVVAQAIGRMGNYFNQELFGAQTTLPWGLAVYLRTPGGVAGTFQDCVNAGKAPEFPTEYIKAVPTVLCGTYHPTFLYELIWDLLVAALIVWADKRFKLGGGRVFALYVAGYTAGRAWIEALRIDPARTHIFGLRVNIVVAIALFVLAVIFLVLRRRKGREDPAVVAGQRSDSDPGAEGLDAEGPDVDDSDADAPSEIDDDADAVTVTGAELIAGDRQPAGATVIVPDPALSDPAPSTTPVPSDPVPSTDPEPPSRR